MRSPNRPLTGLATSLFITLLATDSTVSTGVAFTAPFATRSSLLPHLHRRERQHLSKLMLHNPLPDDALFPRAARGLGSVIYKMRHMGENLLAAMLVVAAVQATIALIQYRTNPSGQLIAPPGLTIGVATPHKIIKRASNQSDSIRPEQMPFSPSLLLAFFRKNAQNSAHTITEGVSRYAKSIHNINRWLVLLIPYASRQLGFILQSYNHLFHLGVVISLAGLFDIPTRWFHFLEEHTPALKRRPQTETPPKASKIGALRFPSIPGTSQNEDAVVKRVVVIGDSLAVGLGVINLFDSSKKYTAPFHRIENVHKKGMSQSDDGAPGPVFPRALAETLADHYQTKVHWRSAGVDGGDTEHIKEHCLEVIAEEVQQGRPPDTVVILCGVNDLKYFVSNPLVNPGPTAFRRRLRQLIAEILALAPNTQIVLPMFPTQMFRANSPLNIFPLNFFLDAIVGFWDSQKRLVADRYPSPNVLYVGLRPNEIMQWYRQSKDDDEQYKNGGGDGDTSGILIRTDRVKDQELIAADGIHPNARCYSLWAKSLGDKIVEARKRNQALA